MKHIHTFESFLNEASSEINEAASYELKDDSGQGKATMVLVLEPESWGKVKNLFDSDGRPVSDEIKKMPAQNTAWSLYAQEYTKGGTTMHKIYGVSGDYTFGNAPTYFQQKLRGNKKAAKEVLTSFVNKYLA